MNDRREWMWANALDALVRAERLHQQLFRPAGAQMRTANWEPPLDILETDQEVLVVAALPGVPPDQVTVRIEGSDLTIAGERPIPPVLRTAVIHRMELPQGRFERRVQLPHGLYHSPAVRVADGCLIISLSKAG
ncbi:Hsp20/alpha crystallin family protein [uncultured Phenylobacterium sp.]|uniref:Hsp20/alpha crystallin family protein n=1 Tax=uncultured Phenylobacterium sp. TaxID=349273 RepID=UPI0025EC6333|nr:Hsp20/alpha crystallin family protein [uncultured Phenylobacterium sp.]